ncbi:MAG: hypothetical protein AAGF47_00300 [Planctomycetota bacterium]
MGDHTSQLSDVCHFHLPEHGEDTASAMLQWHADGKPTHYGLKVAPLKRGDLAIIDDIYANWSLVGLAEKHFSEVLDVELADAESDIERVVKRSGWTLNPKDS